MDVLVTCKNKEVPLKIEGARVVTTIYHCKFMEIFSDAQGQLTPQSEVVSGGNSKSFKLLWLSSLPAKMKKIQSNMKVQEWSQHLTLILQVLNG